MLSRSAALCSLRQVTRASVPRHRQTSAGTFWKTSSIKPLYRSPIIYRCYSSTKSIADEKIEDITELYATAQDEFEIALEETEKVSVYAEEDRNAARQEFEKVKSAFKAVVEGEDKEVAEEVQKRIGQRVRELEQGIERMEEMAKEQD